MGKNNRSTRRNLEERKAKREINKPEASSKTNQPEQAKLSTPNFISGTLTYPPASASSAQTQNASERAKKGKHIMRFFIAVWIRIKRIFGFCDRHDGSITALATVAIVILTAFYVGYSKRQWIAMKGQLDQMKSQSDQSSVSLHQELRPYVSAARFQLIGEIVGGKKFHGTAEMFNSGKTPAIAVRACGDILITPSPEPLAEDYPCPSPDNPKRPLASGPSIFVLGSGVPMPVDSPGTEAVINSIRGAPPLTLPDALSQGHLRMYFYGFVTYTDVILPKVTHHTTFCGMYNSTLNVWVICGTHNSMD
jgi:hypothetical protein